MIVTISFEDPNEKTRIFFLSARQKAWLAVSFAVFLVFLVIGLKDALAFSHFFVNSKIVSFEERDNEKRVRSVLAEIKDDFRTIEWLDRDFRFFAGLSLLQKTNFEKAVPQIRGAKDVDKKISLSLTREKQILKDEERLALTIRSDIRAKLTLWAHTPSIYPTWGRFTSGFGWRRSPFGRWKEFHPGVDIANHQGTPVVATADGVVERASRDGGFGNTVIVSHGYGFKTLFGHLKTIKVHRGEQVKRGQIIGLMGNTGRSTGPHVHYEIIENGSPVNPKYFLLPKSLSRKRFENGLIESIKERVHHDRKMASIFKGVRNSG